MASNSNQSSEINSSNIEARSDGSFGLDRIVLKLSQRLAKDTLIQEVVTGLRDTLEIDRVALYYFRSRWKGRVTFESLSHQKYSIFGMTGADDCFNDTYAELYQAGRYRAIADIESEPIHECHRDFLRSIQVKSNLVVPVLTSNGLWGLLAAHHCQSMRPWESTDIVKMQEGARRLATSPIICDSVLE